MKNDLQPSRISPPSEVSRHRSFHGAGLADSIGRHKLLRVMKFGGTSVADVDCIRRVVEIVRQSHLDSDLVVVVSAMAGVTNSLIEAAGSSKARDVNATAAILERIRDRHLATLHSMVESPEERSRLTQLMEAALQANEQLCQGTALVGELTPRVKDSISSLGERLCAPIVAAALREHGLKGQAVDAREVIATNSNHGAADPLMGRTRELCDLRLRPLLQQGVVPVITGFIGATAEGVLTTLGRGGSDYSATILAAALNADEVVIWTDVDGLLTADPRIIPSAYTIPEVSYREASELAYFGAKVLHPKTLRALKERGTPVWIRNTFSPKAPGTKITKTGPANGSCATAITTISEASLISLSLPAAGAIDLSAKVHALVSAVSSEIFLLSQSSEQNDLSLVVPDSSAKAIVRGLTREFAAEIACGNPEQAVFEAPVALLTLVGENLQGSPNALVRLLRSLGRENISILAVATGPAECKISLVVTRKDLISALIAAHREFEVGSMHLAPLPPAVQPVPWQSPLMQPHSDAD